MYMDDIKPLPQNKKKKTETLTQTVRIYSKNIAMEFGLLLVIKTTNDTWQKESNNQIKKKSERSEKRKHTNTQEYWKMTLSNKWRWKKKKSILGETEIYPRQRYNVGIL